MKFFQSEVVQEELTQMQELYMDINRMGLMLNVEQKREQLNLDAVRIPWQISRVPYNAHS